MQLRNREKELKQAELAVVAGVSSNTLRNVFKELSQNIDSLPAYLFQQN
jgi:hypothetical protein